MCSAKEKVVKVDRVYVGSFMSSLEMAGVSITLLQLDETRTHCLGEASMYGMVKSCGRCHQRKQKATYELTNSRFKFGGGGCWGVGVRVEVCSSDPV